MDNTHKIENKNRKKLGTFVGKQNSDFTSIHHNIEISRAIGIILTLKKALPT